MLEDCRACEGTGWSPEGQARALNDKDIADICKACKGNRRVWGYCEVCDTPLHDYNVSCLACAMKEQGRFKGIINDDDKEGVRDVGHALQPREAAAQLPS